MFIFFRCFGRRWLWLIGCFVKAEIVLGDGDLYRSDVYCIVHGTEAFVFLIYCACFLFYPYLKYEGTKRILFVYLTKLMFVSLTRLIDSANVPTSIFFPKCVHFHIVDFMTCVKLVTRYEFKTGICEWIVCCLAPLVHNIMVWSFSFLLKIL